MREPERPRLRAGWHGRPVQSAALRALILLLPLAAGVAAAALVSRVLPRPEGLPQVGWWLILLLTSFVAVSLIDRAARRLLPLAVLLRLTIVFPDQAPSRFAVARKAANLRALEELVRRARQEGIAGDSVHAAEGILALATALSAHDRRTRGHSERVRVLTDLLAEALELPEHSRERLRWAGLLHDIGKLEVSTDILNKPGKPDPPEWESLKRHPEAGTRLARSLLPWLGEWGPGIEQHHERFDGRGYPRGLAGEDISLAGRIMSVADSFDSMTVGRPYQKPMTVVAARRELTRCAGTQFDPRVVRAFLNVSLGRLRGAVGFMAWIAPIPVVGAAAGALRRGDAGPRSQRVVGVAIATTAALVLTAAPVAAQGFATLHPLAGDTAIRSADGSGFRIGREGDLLHEGDTLRTGLSGRAEIDYFDASLTRLDHDTGFRLRDLEPRPGGRGRKLVVGQQDGGRTFNRVAAGAGPSSRFEIWTPHAVARAEGTVFFTEVRPDGGEAFGVLEGDILVLPRNGGDPLHLGPGRYVEVEPNGQPEAPRDLPRRQLESDWLVYNLCLLDDDPLCPESSDEPSGKAPATKPETGIGGKRGAGVVSPTPSTGPTDGGGTGSETEPPPDEAPPPEPAPAPEPAPQPQPQPQPAPCDIPGQGHGNADPCGAPGHGGAPPGKEKR